MADNITAPATGTVLSTDEIAGVHYPRTKIAFGADGSATDVSPDAPFPVSVAELPLASGASTAANQAALIELVDGIETLLGSLGTQETLAAILAKIVAAPSTEAKQDTIIGHVDGIEPALNSILAKIIAAPATEAKQDALIALSTLPAGTDRSGSITDGGTAQQLAAANVSRKCLTVQNISDADMWINEIGGTAAVDTAGSWKVPAGSVFSVSTNRAVSIVAAATGKKFTATEV